MNLISKYIKPTSATWYSGIALIAFGVMNKDVQSIFEGLGLIGIRGAIK